MVVNKLAAASERCSFLLVIKMEAGVLFVLHWLPTGKCNAMSCVSLIISKCFLEVNNFTDILALRNHIFRMSYKGCIY